MNPYLFDLAEWNIYTIGKDLTWKIERQYLNIRTPIKRLNRRTFCFSKNEKIHDNVIDMYIVKYCYKLGAFRENQPINPLPKIFQF